MAQAPLPNELSRNELLARVSTLDQRVTELEQEKKVLEARLTRTISHANKLAKTLEQERHDLKIMLDITANHGDDLSETLEQERDDLQIVLELTTDHAATIEEDLHHKADELEAHNQFVRDTFGRYASDDVVAQLLDSPEGLELGGEKRTVTIMMSDLRGFTAVAENLDPQQAMGFLNRYLEAMINIILSYQGTIIEILGDGLLVVFGAPISRVDEPQRAVACAISMQLKMEHVNMRLRQANLPEIEMGIGIHTGDVVVGNIGSKQRSKYGVVGHTVNIAGRIESYTTGNQILISPTTYAATADLLTIFREFTVEPKGVLEPIIIYDVGGISGEYQLSLPDSSEARATLAQELPVRYTVLEGKFAGPETFSGHLVKLGSKTAELHSQQPITPLSNLRLQLLPGNQDAIPPLGNLFAKVVGDDPNAAAPQAIVRFTSVPQNVRTYLNALELRHDYRTINRTIER